MGPQGCPCPPSAGEAVPSSPSPDTIHIFHISKTNQAQTYSTCRGAGTAQPHAWPWVPQRDVTVRWGTRGLRPPPPALCIEGVRAWQSLGCTSSPSQEPQGHWNPVVGTLEPPCRALEGVWHPSHPRVVAREPTRVQTPLAGGCCRRVWVPGSGHAHTHNTGPGCGAPSGEAQQSRDSCGRGLGSHPRHTTESWISEPRRTRGLWQAGDTSTKLSRTWRGLFSDSEKARGGPGGSCTGVLTM